MNLWDSFEALSPSNYSKFLEYSRLLPLLKYAHKILVFKKKLDEYSEAEANLKAECRIFKRQFLAKSESFAEDDKPQFTEKLLIYCQELGAVEVLQVLITVAVVALHDQTPPRPLEHETVF